VGGAGKTGGALCGGVLSHAPPNRGRREVTDGADERLAFAVERLRLPSGRVGAGGPSVCPGRRQGCRGRGCATQGSSAPGGSGRSVGGACASWSGGPSVFCGAGDSAATQKGEVNAGRKLSARVGPITRADRGRAGSPPRWERRCVAARTACPRFAIFAVTSGGEVKNAGRKFPGRGSRLQKVEGRLSGGG
jgi:hypothetical protein